MSRRMNLLRFNDLKIMLKGKIKFLVDELRIDYGDIDDRFPEFDKSKSWELINKLLEALHRLEDDAYGYCSECSEVIELDRLRNIPLAIRCKKCEEGFNMESSVTITDRRAEAKKRRKDLRSRLLG